MSLSSERFTTAEASRHRHSSALAKLLAFVFSPDENEPLYDFGCGDGFYLRHIWEQSGGRKKCIGIDASLEIPEKRWEWIIHPVDAASLVSLGPPGSVLCLEVAEHIEARRLPALLANLRRHCNRTLVLSWALRGQGGTRHISCRDPGEVLEMVLPLGFKYNRERSELWRKEAGADLWWFKKSLYIFETC